LTLFTWLAARLALLTTLRLSLLPLLLTSLIGLALLTILSLLALLSLLIVLALLLVTLVGLLLAVLGVLLPLLALLALLALLTILSLLILLILLARLADLIRRILDILRRLTQLLSRLLLAELLLLSLLNALGCIAQRLLSAGWISLLQGLRGLLNGLGRVRVGLLQCLCCLFQATGGVLLLLLIHTWRILHDVVERRCYALCTILSCLIRLLEIAQRLAGSLQLGLTCVCLLVQIIGFFLQSSLRIRQTGKSLLRGYVFLLENVGAGLQCLKQLLPFLRFQRSIGGHVLRDLPQLVGSGIDGRTLC
jgi:hypothetical protein